jgi:hypothetical protein
MRLQTVVDGQAVVAFFSGDTIIHPAYWTEIETWFRTTGS